MLNALKTFCMVLRWKKMNSFDTTNAPNELHNYRKCQNKFIQKLGSVSSLDDSICHTTCGLCKFLAALAKLITI